ncbi:hypothetical protein [Glycomyces tenuis]|uniref:hypothetical protein n=1 Tax=Glycomyces tenuis TaxID=58116 RepID=UPI00047C504A|nr:hypothetical protein [Glycomyces tenuis]
MPTGEREYWLAAHPVGGFDVRERGRNPGPGRGLIAVRSAYRSAASGAVTGPQDRPRPYTPLVLIDGRPAATGFGTGVIEVESGLRLVQVQCGASGAYAHVEVPSAGRVEVSSTVPRWLDHRTTGRRTSGFHGQFEIDPRSGESEASGPWRAVDPGDSRRPGSEPGTAVLRLDLAYVQRPSEEDVEFGVSVSELADRARGERRGPRGPKPFETLGEQLGEDARDLAEGQRRIWSEHRAAQKEIWSASGKDKARAMRGLDLLGESRRPQVRPWVDPPRVTVGDSAVPAIWGVNEYRFAAGAHLIEVAVPPPPEPIGRGAEVSLGGDARLLFELELPEGTMTTIEAIAEIAMTIDAAGTGLASYAATIGAVFAPGA